MRGVRRVHRRTLLLADPETIMTNPFRLFSALACLAFLALTFAIPVRTAPQRPTPAGRPKLIVILVADQLRFDYLRRYSGRFTGGLKRLMEDGAWFERAAYPYLNTVTCPGPFHHRDRDVPVSARHDSEHLVRSQDARRDRLHR
jgi:hypothetical protein